MKDRDFAGAQDLIKQVLGDRPEHEFANGMMGAIYAQLGMFEPAVGHYNLALKANPQNLLARFQLARVLITLEQYAQAEETLVPMLANEQDYIAQFHYGLALARQDRGSEAREFLLKAQQFMPADHPLQGSLHAMLAEPA